MPSRTLPPRPDLAQLKRQASELQREHRDRRQSAAARIIAHHPRFAHASPGEVLAAKLALADTQLVIAREYGFESWASLKHFVETGRRVARFEPHPQFPDALAALVAGDIERLDALLAAHPELVHARTNLEPPYGYFTGATLLHHVAWNPSRKEPVPSNIVDVARLLIDRGADVDAMTLSRSAGTTMGLIVTSRMASEANVSAPLMQLLLDRGAKLDLGTSESVIPDWGRRNPLDVALANYATRAAEKMIELGAKPDVVSVAALGRMDLLKTMFDANGRLRSRPRRGGAELSERDAIGLALLFAYVNHHRDVLDFLLQKDGNWNMTGANNGTVLHRAAWAGDLPLVQRLVAAGADIGNRDNPYMSTPLSWAQHNRQQQIVDWLRANGAIDLHDAVSFGFPEHVTARLAEDPTSVNRQIDHWEVPRSTPLYWACWLGIADSEGEYRRNEADRLALVKLLLERGADPNIVCGDGHTALDVADKAGATAIASVLVEHGAKRGAEL